MKVTPKLNMHGSIMVESLGSMHWGGEKEASTTSKGKLQGHVQCGRNEDEG